MLNVALIGCGKFADAHVGEIRKQSNARLVAVCDREPLMAEQLAVRFGIPKHYGDFATLLKTEQPHVVHITTPPQAHLDLATRAAASGAHIIVEKPLACTHADSMRLLDNVIRFDRKLTIGYRLLLDPASLLMRHMIREGVVGDVVHVESFYGYDLSGVYGSSFLKNPSHWLNAMPGKLLQNTIDHLINKLPEFFPDDDPAVTARASSYSGLIAGGEPLLDELRVIVTGKKTTACATFSSHTRPVLHKMTVYGTKNTLRVDYVPGIVTLAADSKLPGAFGRLSLPFTQSWQYWQQAIRNCRGFMRSDYHFFAGLDNLIRQFYDSVLTGSPLPISYRDIRWVSGVMDQIFTQIGATQAIEVAVPAGR